MAISIDEGLLPLAEAAKILPRRRGRKVATSTLYRWAKRGLRGVCLEVVQVGGTTCTSRSALQRFFNRLTAAARPKTPTMDDRQIEDLRVTERKLDQLGL
ncbi:MAG: DUF1580 domain-containing protein [Planctomycetes bacterium]|nr:DUF1580 domain-containing protein [Planctomycetota bacterium]